MSEQTAAGRHAPYVVEIDSGDEYESQASSAAPARLRRTSVIEIGSDASDDGDGDGDGDDVEIISENRPRSSQADLQITGQVNRPFHFHIEYPGGPPGRPVSRPISRPHSRQVSRPGSRHGNRSRPGTRGDPFLDELRRNVRRRFNGYSQNPFHGAGTLRLPPFTDFTAMMAAQHYPLLQFIGHRDEEVSSSIMERISREEETTLDRKMESENRHNRSVLEKKKDVARGELDGYTNNISPDENIMCELCGIILGEGIPKDFEPDAKYDKNLEHYAASSHVMAPWFCIRQCFDSDRELSKRVFAAKCGHVFCGRCIKNMGNRSQAKGGKGKKEISILNPQISAPRKCPAHECGSAFNKGKKVFTELFL